MKFRRDLSTESIGLIKQRLQEELDEKLEEKQALEVEIQTLGYKIMRVSRYAKEREQGIHNVILAIEVFNY